MGHKATCSISPTPALAVDFPHNVEWLATVDSGPSDADQLLGVLVRVAARVAADGGKRRAARCLRGKS